MIESKVAQKAFCGFWFRVLTCKLTQLRAFLFMLRKTRFLLTLVLLTGIDSCTQFGGANRLAFNEPTPETYPLWFQQERNVATWGQDDFNSHKVYFRNYLKKPDRNLPAFSNSLILNCLDYVIYSALRFKLLTLEEGLDVYWRKSQGEALDQILFPSGSKKITYQIINKKVLFDNQGKVDPLDLILMDGPSHVVQAIELGKKDFRVVSFSPRPIWGDGSSVANLENISPELTTLESLIEEMIELYPDVASDWNQIEILAGKPFWIKN